MISKLNKPALTTQYPELETILIESDVIEVFPDAGKTLIVTEVGTIAVTDGVVSLDPELIPMPTVRGIDANSPLYMPMLSLEMSRLNLIHAVLMQGAKRPQVIKLAS